MYIIRMKKLSFNLMNTIKIYQDKNIIDSNSYVNNHSGSETEKKQNEENKENTNNNNKSNKEEEKKKKIILKAILISSLVLIIILAVVLLCVLKPWKKNKNEENNSEGGEADNNYEINSEEYKKELNLKTTVNDLRRLSLKQISYENLLIDGIEVKMKSFKNKNYDIYIISEQEADLLNKQYYNKIYTGSISIVSQCLSDEDENCEPYKLVDLSNSKKNLRNLKELDDLKDIPIPLCLFNISDNNIILSIKCPESLPENLKNEFISHLNYFRPLDKSSSKKVDKFDIISKDDNIKVITKKSKGSCDLDYKTDSSCDSVFNITKDAKGNLLSIEEISYLNITTDLNNGFKKNKTTKLIDETSKINSLNPDKYKTILNDLLLKLNPYLKYENLFSINNLNQYKTKLLVNEINNVRNLEQDEIIEGTFVKEESLFEKDCFGKKISLNLKIDSGINVESMKALSSLTIGDKDNNLVIQNQITNINEILKKLKSLSKAGNYLALQLYEKLNDNLDNLTKEITIKIGNLNSLIVYKDLTEIFDSSLSFNSLQILPIDIVEETNNLTNKLNIIFNEIENETGEFKNYSNIFKNNINDYLNDSYTFIKNILNNVNKLENLLNLPKNIFTDIEMYYSNNTPNSYDTIIQKVKNIFNNYGKKRDNDINDTTETVLKEFEDNYLETIKKQKNIFNNLYKKLKNSDIKIENAKKEDYENILKDFENFDNYTKVIVDKIKEDLRNIVNSKNKEYILSNNEKNNYNNSINNLINIGNKLDKDEIIDKVFDRIMRNFKENYTNIIKYMDKLKEEKFPLVDNALKESSFTPKVKQDLETNISVCGVEIINKVRNENNNYIKSIKNNVNTFINNNLESLNSLISDLNILLSEESLAEIVYLYDIAFTSSLKQVKADINSFDNSIVDFYYSYSYSIEFALNKFKDKDEFTVISHEKVINQTYYKYFYNIIINNLGNLKNYVNKQLTNDLLNEYKNIIAQIKEVLRLIKNNKITEIYPGINQFNFNKEHINNIDELNNRIDRYLSLEIFNYYYLSYLNDYKKPLLEQLENITKFINNQNNVINGYNPLVNKNGENKDYFLCFEMKCTGKYVNAEYCMKFFYEDRIKITDFTIYTEDNLKKLENFKNISSTINNKASLYNSKINGIKNILNNIEKEALNSIETDYLIPIKNQINLILSQKYEEEIIKSSYNYYKKNLDQKIENILDDIDNKWYDSFNILKKEINNNLNNFKYSIDGFSFYSSFYEYLVPFNISYDYVNSIVNLRKNEFNYTISYYYNYFINIVNSTYLYIINRIPSNDMKLNTIIDLRKKQITDEFNNLIKNIINSKNYILNINKQINVLENEESDFFKINSKISNHFNETRNYLEGVTQELFKLTNNKSENEYSISSRFYLENSESGRQINAIYEQIYDKHFFNLNQEKFKELINDNRKYNIDDITKQINISLYNSNQEIYNDFLVVKENYTLLLEKEINTYFTKEEIIYKINDLYKSEIKLLDKKGFSLLNGNVTDSLYIIKNYLKSEAQRVNTTLTSYTTDFSKINNTLKNYKDYIFNEIKTIAYNIINEFRNNLIKKVYTNYVEKGLDSYINEAKKYTQNLKEYKLINSSYNFGEIIDNIIKDLVFNYKQICKKQIDYGFQLRLNRIESNINLAQLRTFIDQQIDNQYNSTLLTVLKQKAINKPGITGFEEYDFSSTIKDDIEKKMKIKINNINNVLSMLIKGSNYQANIDSWKTIDFSKINKKINEIENYFENFMNSEKSHENNYINDTIKNIIKSNFNKLLNRTLELFGIDFFERFEKFNEYFRIINLYDNLKCSLIQPLLYYKNLNDFDKNVNPLPKELKTKILNLNNFDLLITENKNYLIQLPNLYIEEFINDSKDNFIKNYLKFVENSEDFVINFDKNITDIIKDNLNMIKTDIEKDYSNVLNSYINQNFIFPYSETINKKTEEVIEYIKENQERVRNELNDSLFTIEPENILEEINLQINMTLDLIKEYNSHLDVFKMPDELKEFLHNLVKNGIKPIYDVFKKKIDELSTNQIISNFEKNSKKYEKSFNLNEFEELYNTTFLDLKDNYIDNITQYLRHFYSKYSLNFEKEAFKEYEEIINYKPSEETFQKILTNFENTKLFIETLKEFNDYDKIILNNINKLNIAFKESKKLIEDNKYEEEIDNNFTKKLLNLKEKSLDYYNKIKESYFNIKKYLNESIQNISNDINKCIEISNETLIDEYKELSEEEPIDIEYTRNEEELNQFEDKFKIDDNNYKIEVDIKNLKHYAKFIYKIEFEDNDYKKPKIVASIINKSIPKNINIGVYSVYGCKNGIIINSNFEDATYSMNLNKDIKSTYINATTITNFEEYIYNYQQYQEKEIEETFCFTVAYIEFCISTSQCSNITTLINEDKINEKKELVETNFIKY